MFYNLPNFKEMSSNIDRIAGKLLQIKKFECIKGNTNIKAKDCLTIEIELGYKEKWYINNKETAPFGIAIHLNRPLCKKEKSMFD